MILVRQRQDLLDQDLLIPVKLFKGGEKCVRIDRWMFASQPDELDDSEYNLLLYTKTTPHELIGVAINIDFDYKDVPDESRKI